VLQEQLERIQQLEAELHELRVDRVLAGSDRPAAANTAAAAASAAAADDADAEMAMPVFGTFSGDDKLEAGGADGGAGAESGSEEEDQHNLDRVSAGLEEKQKLLASKSAYNAKLQKLNVKAASEAAALRLRMQQLEAETKTLTSANVADVAGSSGPGVAAGATERQKQTRLRLQELKKELDDSKRQLKTATKVQSMFELSKKSVSSLTHEIVDMKNQRATLQRRLKDEAAVHRAESNKQKHELGQLVKQVRSRPLSCPLAVCDGGQVSDCRDCLRHVLCTNALFTNMSGGGDLRMPHRKIRFSLRAFCVVSRAVRISLSSRRARVWRSSTRLSSAERRRLSLL
jgi:hypothetical protein